MSSVCLVSVMSISPLGSARSPPRARKKLWSPSPQGFPRDPPPGYIPVHNVPKPPKSGNWKTHEVQKQTAVNFKACRTFRKTQWSPSSLLLKMMKTVFRFLFLCYLAEVTGKIHVEVRFCRYFWSNCRSVCSCRGLLDNLYLRKQKNFFSTRLESCELLFMKPKTTTNTKPLKWPNKHQLRR